MPASRNCTRCGAALPGAVRWCGQCYEPVREFTPRAPLHRGDYVDAPRSIEATTRRGGDETSFGLVGRIVITLVLVSMLLALIAFTNAAGLLFLYPTAVLPGGILSAWILKETWRAVPVSGVGYRAPLRLADVRDAMRQPSFREMSRGRRWAVAAGATGYAALVVVYFQLPDDWQVGFMMFLGLLGTGLLAATVLRRD